MKNAWMLFWEIVKGGLITARHFFTNLWFHFLRLIGIKKFRPGAGTKLGARLPESIVTQCG